MGLGVKAAGASETRLAQSPTARHTDPSRG